MGTELWSSQGRVSPRGRVTVTAPSWARSRRDILETELSEFSCAAPTGAVHTLLTFLGRLRDSRQTQTHFLGDERPFVLTQP